MMNKILKSALLLFCGAAFVTACSDDNDSNPELIQGTTTIVLNTPEFAQQNVALGNTSSVTITWSQPVFTTDNAPLASSGSLGINYAVQVSKDGNFTRTFEAALAEVTNEDGTYSGAPSSYDYVELPTTYSSCKADIGSDELNLALNKLNLWSAEDALPITEAFVRVVARLSYSTGAQQVLATSNIQKMLLIPSGWVDVMAEPVKEAYLWIPGNGNGWNHGVCPILVSEDGVFFSGYAYMNGEFKFTPVDNWSAEYNNGSFTTVSDNIDCGDGGGGNINFTGDPGMYFFTVDLDSKTVNATAVTWSVIGGFNGWGGDEVMTYDEGNHCLSVTVNFEEATEFKFRRDTDWGINLGGTFDALEQDGANLNADAGEHTIQLFIERPAQDGLHAAIK